MIATTADRVMLYPSEDLGDGFTIPATYGTPLRTERMLGRCRIAGCQHRVTIDITAFRIRNSQGISECEMAATGNEAKPWVSVHAGRYSVQPPKAFPELLQLGLFCPEHRCRLKLNTLKARHVPTIKCTGRCWNATSDKCECECDGKRHGEAWASCR